MQELALDLSLDLPQDGAGHGAGGEAEVPSASLADPFNIVGTRIQDTFDVERVVAHGGFGVVYKAKHLRFAAPVALKCLKIPTNLTQEEREKFLDRFVKEGEVMFRLSSSISEVVRPLQVDSFKLLDGRLVPYIAFEWLNGETLKDVIVRRLNENKRPIALPGAVGLLTSVARALARAHRFPSAEGTLSILHCDLKPDNVFVTEVDGGQIFKIFDFGIAKVRSAATRQVGGFTAETQSNMFTPAYAAPEQWAPDRYGQTGPWTDVFGLALTLTELVTQRPAIDGAPTAMLTQCLDEKKRPTPRRLGLKCSDRLESIFVKALAVNPAKRYQSIEEFWGDLERELGLPPQLNQVGRLSITGVTAFLPESWEAEAPLSDPPPSAQRPLMPVAFDGDLDLGAPRSSPMPAPPAAPQAPMAPPQPPGFDMGAFDLAEAAPSSAMVPKAPSPPPPSAPPPGLAGSELDLAEEMPPRSQRVPEGQGALPQPLPPQPSYPGMMQAPGASGQFPATPGEAGPASAQTREKLQAVAAKAGQVATVAAKQTAQVAAMAAKTIATKALEVDRRHEIRLDDPSTWIKPMLGPIIAMAAAVVISIGAVIMNKVSGSNSSVVAISLPLMIASIGFAVYRYIKLTRM